MTLRKRLLQNRRLYLIVNITPTQRPSSARLEAILRSGVDIVQLRCKPRTFGKVQGKELSDRVFLEYAFELRRLSRVNNLIFIINDRADIALASEADGLHIGQDDIPPHLARKILGNKKILGLSTHNLTQIKRARACKEIDYIGIGPIFKTETKPKRRPIGLSLIRDISKDKKLLPFFSIGGITVNNLNRLIRAGADRIAVCSAVFNSKNPAKTVGKFREILYDPD